MEIGTGSGEIRKIPFTGKYMLHARQQVLALSGEQGCSQDQKEILKGIQGVFEIVAARPDTSRYSEELIGQAYMCALVDRAGRIDASISDVDFGRKARADLLRAKISRLVPDHPEGLMTPDVISLDEFLQDAGIHTDEPAGTTGSGKDGFTNDALRALISSEPAISRDVFGALTTLPFDKIGLQVISAQAYDFLLEEYQDHLLSGSWIDQAAERMALTLGAEARDGQFEMKFLSVDDRDIMLVRDAASIMSGQAFVYSWPLTHRLTLARLDRTTVLNISPEEIPDVSEIHRLQKIHDALSADKYLDAQARPQEEIA
jgi:hypothetical protein